MEASPRFNAKGMAWWNDRLIIVNREPAILHAFTSPDKFEIQSGGSMKSLIVSLLTSDSFLYRKADDPNG